VQVSEEGSGATVPCRITVTRTDGTLQPLTAHPARDVAVRTGVVYTRDGSAQLELPPGRYVLFAGRGMEWSVASATVDLTEGVNHPVEMKLTREVDTRGWVAVDSHIHTLTHSRHGDATTAERAITIAGEGIELAIATDHNHHTDYAPVVAELNLEGRFTAVVGNEITTKRGHFNAFPVKASAPVVNALEEDWARLLPSIRNTPGVRVVTLNHPRDLHGGFIPFGKDHFHAESGSLHSGGIQHIDAVEVITSGAMQSDIGLLFRDWFALLNHGHRMAAIGSSDTHDVSRFILGQGRTYVAASDAHPGRIPVEEVWRSYAAGRVLVSMGLFVTLRVQGKFGVGELASCAGNTIEVETEVHGPSWVKADHVALYANGTLVREARIEGADQALPGRKAVVRWSIPKPLHDMYLVAIATGPGVTGPFWEIPRPYQPAAPKFEPRVLGATNPVWMDCDASGTFEAAIDYARDLVKKHGAAPKTLATALREYDPSVAVQVKALIEKPAAPAP
jgi:hypothetical protein